MPPSGCHVLGLAGGMILDDNSTRLIVNATPLARMLLNAVIPCVVK